MNSINCGHPVLVEIGLGYVAQRDEQGLMLLASIFLRHKLPD